MPIDSMRTSPAVHVVATPATDALAALATYQFIADLHEFGVLFVFLLQLLFHSRSLDFLAFQIQT